jgi:hypothetical protein
MEQREQLRSESLLELARELRTVLGSLLALESLLAKGQPLAPQREWAWRLALA